VKRILRSVAVLIGVALAIATFGYGTASASDPLVGKSYAEASAKISGWKGTAVIATVNGSSLATDDCIVASWQKSMFIDSTGKGRGSEFLLNLDCNALIAGPGKPGNSVMSAEGKKAKKDELDATYVAKNPKVCEKDANVVAWCTQLCKRTGLCDFSA
jgi:hypothetical protein